MLPELQATAATGSRMHALHAYATIRMLIGDLDELGAKDCELAGRITHPAALVSENLFRSDASYRVLAELESTGHSMAQPAAEESEALQTLAGAHALKNR
ncbi:hypothetical protein [Roseisolibacter agri]|uniref:Uncharacterized protein n=1 Tax=Roseisolibacter agri TaxID=2014610 RepID=A0AA37Q363_9BACT|nr:hypothetical protein [Roseisolibacter agri]GLC25539.1 hypothetical protein rosag_20520 [Roseisolibacter agri]